jgi:hypothetical protein
LPLAGVNRAATANLPAPKYCNPSRKACSLKSSSGSDGIFTPFNGFFDLIIPFSNQEVRRCRLNRDTCHTDGHGDTVALAGAQ